MTRRAKRPGAGSGPTLLNYYGHDTSRRDTESRSPCARDDRVATRCDGVAVEYLIGSLRRLEFQESCPVFRFQSNFPVGRNAQVKSLNQGSPGNRGKGNGVKVSNGSSQSARKNTATVRAEPIASSTISSLSRSRLMQRQRSEQRATASQAEPCGSMCCVLINPQARNGGYCGTPSTPMMRNFACLLPIVLTSL